MRYTIGANNDKLEAVVIRGTQAILAIACVALAGFESAVAGIPSNSQDYARTESFTYNADGSVATRTVEPTDPDSCRITSYQYLNGRVISETVNPCTSTAGNARFAPRGVSSKFAAVAAQAIVVQGTSVPVAIAAGVFKTSSTNALGQGASRTYDPRYGAVLQSVDENNLTSIKEVDDWGRSVRLLHPDGTGTRLKYCVLGSSGLSTATNSAGCPTPSPAEIPPDAVQFLHVEPRDANDAKSGPFVRRYLDRVGHELRSATESFDGAGQPAARKGAVLVQDNVYGASGVVVMSTGAYFLASGSSSTAGADDVPVVHVTYDRLGRHSVVRVSDPVGLAPGTFAFGGGTSVAYGKYGTRKAAVTTYEYEGLSTVVVNDKGQTKRLLNDPMGRLAKVTDALGAEVAFGYDAFGNQTQVQDALGNKTLVTFDSLGRRVGLKDPDNGLTRWCFDALGQAVAYQTAAMRGNNAWTACPSSFFDSTTTAPGIAGWLTTAYDQLSRGVQVRAPELTIDRSFDRYADGSACATGVGRLCEQATSAGVRERYKFDAIGRTTAKRLDVTSGPSMVMASGYDSVTGRPTTLTYPSGVSTALAYTPLGYVEKESLSTALTIAVLPSTPGGTPSCGAPGCTASVPAGTALWTVQTAGERTEVISLANGLQDRTTRTAGPPRVATRSVGADANDDSVLSQGYTWDSIGNLVARTDLKADAAGAVSETFAYDALNRLSSYAVSGPGVPDLSRNVTLQYNALGLLLSKSDTGNYSYPVQGAGSVRPHAVLAVAQPDGVTRDFGYDADGNVISADAGKFSGLTYNTFGRVATAAGPAASYSWGYDGVFQRVRTTRTIGSGVMAGTRTTWYFHPDAAGSLLFETEVNAPTSASAQNPSTITHRHFFGRGIAKGVLVTTGSLPTLTATQFAPTALSSSGASKLEYWHVDHLGSVVATTSHDRTVTARSSYDPFGKRRFASGAYDANSGIVTDWSPATIAGTGRGFTGHEEHDDIGIVNMNGRVYDDHLARFLQVDPVISEPTNLQAFNRYAYLSNNPLNATDPTGFQSSISDLREAMASQPQYAELGRVEITGNRAREPKTVIHLQFASQQEAVNLARGMQQQQRARQLQSFERGFAGVDGGKDDASVDWVAGRALGLAFEGPAETAALLRDIAAGATNGILMKVGLEELTTGMQSSIMKAVGSGEITPNQALYFVLTAPAQTVKDVAVQVAQGNYQEAAAQAVTLAAPFRRGGVPKGSAAAKGTQLTFDKAARTWTSPGGLVYGEGSGQGNRVLHVLDHAAPNPSKPVHSVFNVDRNQVLGLVDEAWAARVGPGTLQANGNRFWVVDMGRQVGTGGQTSVQIVVRDGTTQVITAFPK